MHNPLHIDNMFVYIYIYGGLFFIFDDIPRSNCGAKLQQKQQRQYHAASKVLFELIQIKILNFAPQKCLFDDHS